MNPVVKYTLARLGLFVLVAAVLIALPVPVNVLIKLAVAIVVSAALSLFLLRGLRNQVVDHWATTARERAERKEQLRAALAGDDTDPDVPRPPGAGGAASGGPDGTASGDVAAR